ncbi:GyrI-like domain-containing protein [Pollutibacter soli]|uniref:GyrI-like domain-containing protein n=1 Tax=Pollutibacter soli TaxID=3034157 RepID=UPI00301401A8
MEYRIENIKGRTLAGMNRQMSFAEDQTAILWRSFMPRRKEIVNAIGSDLYSLQVYPEGFFDEFSPLETFTKWAAVEIPERNKVPDGMETMQLPAGLYAVFTYRGPSGKGAEAFEYIFTKWLPDSGYQLDDRPYFELLGEKYKNNDPESEEEIFIPVRPAGTSTF